jgi:hypothetical protein
MTTTPTAPVRLSDHWRDPARVEADELTLRRAAKALIAAGYSVTAAPPDTSAPEGGSFWCDDLDAHNLRRVLIDAGIPAVIATVTRPTPAEEAEDEAAWQEAEVGMEAEAQAYVESEAQRPTPEPWAPF